MNRRSFFAGIAALVVAPKILKPQPLVITHIDHARKIITLEHAPFDLGVQMKFLEDDLLGYRTTTGETWMETRIVRA